METKTKPEDKNIKKEELENCVMLAILAMNNSVQSHQIPKYIEEKLQLYLKPGPLHITLAKLYDKGYACTKPVPPQSTQQKEYALWYVTDLGKAMIIGALNNLSKIAPEAFKTTEPNPLLNWIG